MDLAHLKEIGIFSWPKVWPESMAARPMEAPTASLPSSASRRDEGPQEQQQDGGKKVAKSVLKAKGKGPASAGAAAAEAPSGPVEPPPDVTEEQLKKMSKDERGKYWAAKRAYEQYQKQAGGPDAAAAMPKAKSKQERRALQESQRKAKEDIKHAGLELKEMIDELKMQGLTEEQALEMVKDIAAQEKAGAGDDEEDLGEEEEQETDYLTDVREWMVRQPAGPLSKDIANDYNTKVRFQGHGNKLATDALGAILTVLTEQACSSCDLTNPRLQPTAVVAAMAPLLDRWQGILRNFYSKSGESTDLLNAVDAILVAVQTGVEAIGTGTQACRDVALVGCLMALRDVDDLVDDEDLGIVLRKQEQKSRVMEQFIEFLDEADEDEEDDDDDD